MTIKELYAWAKINDALELEMIHDEDPTEDIPNYNYIHFPFVFNREEMDKMTANYFSEKCSYIKGDKFVVF